MPAGTYQGVELTPTLAVGAQWVTNASEHEDLVYEITKTLWRLRRGVSSMWATPRANW